jgi:dinuclear metal center YbgI/SA1388 family protein
MIPRDTLLAFLEETFLVSRCQDVSYNGLQFEGTPTIKKIVTGVDATVPFFHRALTEKADFALVHHGLFWKGGEWKKIDRLAQEKVLLLARGSLNLYGLHLPLDAHSELGNNAQLARALQATPCEPFSDFLGQKIGLVTEFATALSPDALSKRIQKAIGPVVCHLPFGGKKVKRLGIVSGGGWNSVTDPLVFQGRLDAILTGEIIHQAVAPCRDLGIHMFAAGHYATETFGVKALGEAISKKFGIPHRFLDFPTGL